MIERKDLTRWNRAGLSRFRYVDGNAVTFLEKLRKALIARFTDPVDGELQWSALAEAIPQAPGENERDRWDRILAQYSDGRRDYGWEIVRALARSIHVLGEHVDSYANESYLRTATQWDNVRRLVEMLDYHSAPPASASTSVALFAKEGESGTVHAGLQMKNAPADGSPPLIFETLEDLEVDHRLNQLRLKDWNKSLKAFSFTAAPGDPQTKAASFAIGEELEGISSGSLGILQAQDGQSDAEAVAVEVTEVKADSLTLKWHDPDGNALDGAQLHQMRLLLTPDWIQSPRLRGVSSVVLKGPHSLTANTAVAWKIGSTWKVGRVGQVDGARISMVDAQGNPHPAPPPADASIFALNSSIRQRVRVGGFAVNRVFIPQANQLRTSTIWGEDLQVIPSSQIESESDSGFESYRYLKNPGANRVAFFLLSEADSSAVVAEAASQNLVFDGDPGELASGDWIIAADKTQMLAAQIAAVETGEGEFTLFLANSSINGEKTFYGLFADELRPQGHDVNSDPIFDPAQRSEQSTVLPLEGLPEGLQKGRRLIVKNASQAFEARVGAIDESAGTITVTPAIPGSEPGAASGSSGFSRQDTVIYANVAPAGHGESKPERILGSGDATRAEESFELEVESVSFVADPSQPSGMAAAVEVIVDNRTWKQVGSLNDSRPTDPHYTVRITQDGHLRFSFGDGFRGRRLPTGTNNVRAVYRVGTGAAGNLAAASLEKIVQPHPLLESVEQPLLAAGGNEMESVESLRENAPASVLSMDRAVSLSDFTHLAGRHSSVWQARAFSAPTRQGRYDDVKVVVVPAGGGELGDLNQALTGFLSSHALPGAQVEVCGYQPVILDLTIAVRIVSAEFDALEVSTQVREELQSAFSLRSSALAAPFYRSSLFKVVEEVDGVRNASCAIRESSLQDNGAELRFRHVARGADGVIRSIRPLDEQVIYIDPERSILKIEVQEFTL